MNTNRKRFANNLATCRANLARIPGRNFNYASSSSAFRLLDKKIKEFSPRNIRDGFAQVSILDHALYIQVFNIDFSILFNIEVGGFAKKIISLVSNFLVSFGNKQTRFLPAIRPTLFTTKISLPAPKKFCAFTKKLRVTNEVPLGISQEILNPNINPYLGITCRQGSDGNVIAGKHDKPLAGRTLFDCYVFDNALNRSGKKHLEPANILDIQIPTFKLPARLFERKRFISVSTFEAREPKLALEKELECFVESLKNVLKYLRTNCFELREIIFQANKLFHLSIGRNRFALFASSYSLLKSHVIESSTQPKPLMTIGFCFFVYYGPIFESSSHFFFLGTSQYGLLHFGQVRILDFRGTHVWPQRSHSTFLISIFIIITLPYNNMFVNKKLKLNLALYPHS